jgi:hypothetical protein
LNLYSLTFLHYSVLKFPHNSNLLNSSGGVGSLIAFTFTSQSFVFLPYTLRLIEHFQILPSIADLPVVIYTLVCRAGSANSNSHSHHIRTNKLLAIRIAFVH